MNCAWTFAHLPTLRPLVLRITLCLLAVPASLLSPCRAADRPAKTPLTRPSTLFASPFVRVGLSRFASSSTLTLTAFPGARLIGPDGQEKAAGTGPWTVVATGGGAQVNDARGRRLGLARGENCWRLQCEDGDAVLGIGLPGRAPRHYRGCLEVRAVGSALRAINEVALETYLRGVVPSEMGSDAPFEAMKTQAVASRSFALSRLSQPTNTSYDLPDTTDAQVYGGADAETPNSDRAIRETTGEILVVGRQPLRAVYCADCGGITAPGATPDECPHSVVDTQANPNPRVWTLRFSPERLTSLLRREMPSRTASLVLCDVSIADKDISGRVRRLRLGWNMPEAKKSTTAPDPSEALPSISSDSPPDDTPDEFLAAPLPSAGPPSDTSASALLAPRFASEIGGNALRLRLGVDTLKSTLFAVHRAPNGDFIFEGRGWGHGRGMCQTGARNLATTQNYRAILLHYYGGATLMQMRDLQPDDERMEGGEEGAQGENTANERPMRFAGETTKVGTGRISRQHATGDREAVRGR